MENPRLPDTIAAIATAPGRGGIGVVRLSGADLKPYASGLLGRIPSPRQATHTRFLGGTGEAIDDGIALYFPAPHSYTGEDVLELQGHGGPVVMQLLLGRCLELGARLAEPGEFTRRAFLNDKLDLAQAEAVIDIIEASTAAAARSALRSLSGEFSRAVQGLVERLIQLRMLVESTLDFPDEDIDFLEAAHAKEELDAVCNEVGAIRAKARQGSLLRSGLNVVLAGQPNVGKSSLLNQLTGEDRAIVTAVPGTTRDALRETMQVRGIPLHIIDTAGLRETEDEVERIGISRTWREIETADVIVYLVDARLGVTEADLAIEARLPPGIERLTVLNKADLAGFGVGRSAGTEGIRLTLSAKTGEGIDLLRQELLRVAGWQGTGEDVFLARERHLSALMRTADHLERARCQMRALELLAEELRLAQEALSEITGEFTADDLLGEIFSRFCVGK